MFYFFNKLSLEVKDIKELEEFKTDYQDIDGNYKHRVAEDFEAIVFSHEIDHLDGIEFVDKAEDLIYDADLEKRIEIRNKNPKIIISRDIEFNQDNIDDKFKTKIYKRI